MKGDTMENEQVKLEVKKGWKIFLTVNFLLIILCVGYLGKQFYSVMEYVGTGGIFMIFFMVLCLSVGVYSVLYGLNHYIIFDTSGMVRKGVFMERNISYSNISELRFSDSFWDMHPAINLLGDYSAILIDEKYQNKEEAKAFLNRVLDTDQMKMIDN